jgi:hypothetical protein
MPSLAGSSGRIESAVSWAILAVLAGIAVGIYFQQFHYAAFVIPQEGGSNLAEAGATEGLSILAYAGSGLAAMSAMETFSRDSLSDKIDGKAELYLPAGVKSMKCQRLADRDDKAAWMEVFVYDMGEPANAVTVFTRQKRPGVTDLAEMAYKTPNSLHFACGDYYVEMIAAGGGKKMLSAMEAYWRKFTADVSAASPASPAGAAVATVDVTGLFPQEGLVKGSAAKAAADEFGIEGFDDVYTATYNIDGTAATAFIARKANEKEAAATADGYRRYFDRFGGKDSAIESMPAAKLIDVMDVYKVVLTSGRYVAGVHETADKAAAIKLARAIQRRLAEAGK